MAESNEDETENTVRNRELEVYFSIIDVSSHAPLLLPLMKVKKDSFISEDSISNQSDVIVKPVHNKNN